MNAILSKAVEDPSNLNILHISTWLSSISSADILEKAKEKITIIINDDEWDEYDSDNYFDNIGDSDGNVDSDYNGDSDNNVDSDNSGDSDNTGE